MNPSERVAALERLVRLRDSGILGEDEFVEAKQQILNDNQMNTTGSGSSFVARVPVTLLYFIFGMACIYLNGWDFIMADWAFSNTTKAGFFVGDASGTLAFLIEVNHDWYGVARIHPDWALIDSKVLNCGGLAVGIASIFYSIGFLFGIED